MGCQQLQGYLLSPPLEPAQLVALPGLSSANATTEAAASA
jgi:EAL domain-containing protein (putative c-di-GMP-specific phosphodiesterase class I)